MKITTHFDSGKISVIKLTEPTDIQLALVNDSHSEQTQWFHFGLQTAANKLHQIAITNASESRFAHAWKDYQVVASYDQQNWFRVNTRYDGQSLIFAHTPTESMIYYAYFTPYSMQRHHQLIERAKRHPLVSHRSLGNTPDGQAIDLLAIGNLQSPQNRIWIIGRQHPGETMAEWFTEGMIEQLLSQDKVAESLLANHAFYIVPNMNPDGSVRGNHRTNAKGKNLNREWDKSSIEQSPEVYYVRQAMHETGIDLFIDVHGDETIPYNFMMGGSSSEPLKNAAEIFKQDFVKANDEFQFEVDYDNFPQASDCAGSSSGCCSVSKNACGKKDLSKASYYVTHHFNCLSLVLEMPFIDNANRPNPETGWSAERSMALGASLIEPIFNYVYQEGGHREEAHQDGHILSKTG